MRRAKTSQVGLQNLGFPKSRKPTCEVYLKLATQIFRSRAFR